MKFFGVLTLLVSFSALVGQAAQASNLQTVTSFSVLRSGGGMREIVVGRSKGGTVFGYTKSCFGRDLAPSDQAKSKFVLQGAVQAEALEILNNDAILASEATMLPILATGTWVSFAVSYDYSDYDESRKSDTIKIDRPVVLVKGQLSSVIGDVESAGRAAAKDLCN